MCEKTLVHTPVGSSPLRPHQHALAKFGPERFNYLKMNYLIPELELTECS